MHQEVKQTELDIEEFRYIMRIVKGDPIPFRVTPDRAKKNPELYFTWKEIANKINEHYLNKAKVWEHPDEDLYTDIQRGFDEASSTNTYLDLYGTP